LSHERRQRRRGGPAALDYPAKLKIGLCASNLSKKPFTPKFGSFILVDDQSTLEEDFGD
jgi:hypothetical protein